MAKPTLAVDEIVGLAGNIYAHPLGAPYTYIVIGLDGGVVALMTRRVFKTRDDAQHYCESVASSRNPMVVEGRFDDLRIPPKKEK